MENRLASLLIRKSLGVTIEDVVVVDYQNHSEELLDCVQRELIVIGAESRIFSRKTCETIEHLGELDKILNGATAYLRIDGGKYESPSGERGFEIQRKEGEIMNKRCALKWTLTPYPSEYMAKEIGTSLDNLRRVYFESSFVDYIDQRKIQGDIASLFTPGTISIKAPDVDISFGIVNSPHFCDGKINLPDGEVFWEVDPYATRGDILFDIPFFFGSARFKEIFLRFEGGKVVDYDSDQRKSLKDLLETDVEAKQLGEFGIGTNPVARIIGNSFIDEKVMGTFHLAIGAMGRGLKSKLHMDMVKKLEGCEIKNNGQVVNLLEYINNI